MGTSNNTRFSVISDLSERLQRVWLAGPRLETVLMLGGRPSRPFCAMPPGLHP
jgi:hypothetical protein